MNPEAAVGVSAVIRPRAFAIVARPAVVSRYFWRQLFGVSGMVSSIMRSAVSCLMAAFW